MVKKTMFCKLLREAIKDEAKARDIEYPELVNAIKKTSLPSYTKEGFTDIVIEIREDEGKHFATLNTVFNAICKVKNIP